ncbi:MAG: hypothetical protein FWG46_02515 [Treponema sp.]|nr:hypothetical protein [Treponema sp.]
MLPVVIIVILLFSAVSLSVVKKSGFAKAMTLLSLGIGFVLSMMCAIATGNGETIKLVLGSPPWNLSVSVGMLEAFMGCIFTGIGFLIMWASCTMIEHDVEKRYVPLYYALICTLIAMLCGVVFFDNLFNVFIFIELSSFAAACIVIIKNQPENVRAGLKYLALSILGSGFVLMAIVILYSLTKDIDKALTISAIGNAFTHHHAFDHHETAVFFALLFLTIGIGFKSALFPMHIWLPDAHGTAPSPSSAVLSSLVLKAYVVFYIKMVFGAVSQSTFSHDNNILMLMSAVLVFGVVAMLAGSVMAILQTDIKRMIAYSSVAQIGYIFMGIGLGGLGTKEGLYAAIFHIFAHAITKAGLFLVAGSIIEQTHNRRLDKMQGLGYQMPVTMTFFLIGALSMVGIPMFIGFNSKWNFAMSIMGSGKFWVMVALVISSLLNALYYLPVVIRSFFGPEARAKAEGPKVERPISALLPIGLLSCGVILFAIFANSTLVPFLNDAIKGFDIEKVVFAVKAAAESVHH